MNIPDVPLIDHVITCAWLAGIALVAIVKFVGVCWCIKTVLRFLVAYESKKP